MIDSEAEVFPATPGRRNVLTLTVQNTRDVIDGVRTQISGIDNSYVTVPVAAVSIYPGMSESVRVYLDLPRTFPEGVPERCWTHPRSPGDLSGTTPRSAVRHFMENCPVFIENCPDFALLNIGAARQKYAFLQCFLHVLKIIQNHSTIVRKSMKN